MIETATIISIIDGILLLVVGCLLNSFVKYLRDQMEREKQIAEILQRVLRILSKEGML